VISFFKTNFRRWMIRRERNILIMSNKPEAIRAINLRDKELESTITIAGATTAGNSGVLDLLGLKTQPYELEIDAGGITTGTVAGVIQFCDSPAFASGVTSGTLGTISPGDTKRYRPTADTPRYVRLQATPTGGTAGDTMILRMVF